jgi:serine acetyltransferase
VGEFFLDKETDDVQVAKDVIVEEDVWIAANVTLLAGVKVGRGAFIGSGSVCRTSIPPYSIVIGNPAKVIGFKFSPEEIIKHEEMLYEKDERMSLELLEKNYKKYFIDRIDDIKTFIKL